ncbi:MAG: proteasome accessory factor PafA2 family protein [Parcubacteria group bacterium]|nr:proteasome accessory factor PafA2 family protein [Parcubacteria group bacterium]
MGKPEKWKMLFGVENEYNTNCLYYDDYVLGSRIAYEVVSATRQFGGFSEGDYFPEWMKRASELFKRFVSSRRSSEERTDAIRRLGFSGYRLPNRMRIYVDLGHPEISTAECTTPKELLLQQKAGERMIDLMRQRATEKLGLSDDPIVICKNNSSGFKTGKMAGGRTGYTSWATHENYLVPPDLFEEITRDPANLSSPRTALWLAFLVSRIYGGSGKVGAEMLMPACPYQLFQRADFIEQLTSLDTTGLRGLINTRDHPYATRSKYRRLHVICGDALIAPWSIYVTYGATALFLKMLAERFPFKPISVHDPVSTLHAVSRDVTGKKRLIRLAGEKTKLSALELQKYFAEEMKRYLEESGADIFGDTVEKLRFILGLFEDDPQRLKFYLDFAIKRELLGLLQEEKSMSGDALKLAALDYHDMNPEDGSYFALEKEGFPDGPIAGIGSPNGIVTPAEIERAISHPPTDSRAYFGGEVVRRFKEEILALSWNTIEVQRRKRSSPPKLVFYDPWCGTKEKAADAFEGSATLPELLERLGMS